MKVESYNLEMDDMRHPTMVRENEYETDVLNIHCPEDIDRFCRNSLRMDKMCEEYVYLICMDNKGSVSGIFPVSHGSANSSYCNPREILIRALLCGAVSFAMVHNHPSGITEPSEDDFKSCKKVKEAGGIVGVQMVDSLIIGNGYYSFLEHNAF